MPRRLQIQPGSSNNFCQILVDHELEIMISMHGGMVETR
uniref:Uncharacterized protein n=1 Tax=Rhizophora mucronata TaxID=61149 RepID=A0A2P2NHU5_RHIMU